MVELHARGGIRKVILPLAAPGIFTTAIIVFIVPGTNSC